MTLSPANREVRAMARVLGRIRLSRSTEESTSVDRQTQSVEMWCQMHGHEIIGWAIDLDVSGSTDPFETPEFGGWLTDAKAVEYDIICAYRLDRVSRRVIPLNKLFGWVLDRGKSLAT